MSAAEFGAATPRMVVAAWERKREQVEAAERAANVRFGTIAAMTLNAQGVQKVGGGGSWNWADFFGEEKEPDPELLREKMRTAAAVLNARPRRVG